MGRKTHGPILVAAIEHGDFEKVREIILTHFKSKQRIQELCISEVRRLATEYTEVPVLLAATLPDPTILKFLVTKQDVNINYVHKEVVKRKTKVKTALIVAVRAGLVNTVEAILAMNADPNLQDHKLRTALHHAVRKADYRLAKMLLTRGAQPNIVDAAGNTPLHIATIFGHTELVKLFIRHDADVFKKGTGGAIPMHMAAKEGHSVLVKLFCDYEVNVNMKVPCYDNREKAPIHVAAEEGHAETVMVLLDQCGADPNIRDSTGETPLHCSCLREYDPMGMKSKDDYTETTKVLLNSGAHIDLQNARGETPLHLAARNEFQKTVEVLLRAGSDPIIEDSNGYKPYDLTTADDTVTIQLLKSAMEEQTRIMNDALEVQAKGYSTSMVRPSVSSRNGLNHIDSDEFLVTAGDQSRSYEDGYLQPASLGLRNNNKSASLSGSSQDLLGKTHSSSSSGNSRPNFNRNQKNSRSLLPQFRLRASNNKLNQSNDSLRSFNIRTGKINEVSSPSDVNKNRVLPDPPVELRQKSSVRPDTDSFWDITPHPSISSFRPQESDDETRKSYESLPNTSPKKQQPTRVKNVKPSPQGSKKMIPIQPAFPNANKLPESAVKREATDDDDSFFDDESFDTLDSLSDKESVQAPVPAKRIIPPKNKKYTPEEQNKIQSAISNVSLHSWLNEQAEIIETEGMPKPVSKPAASEVDTYSMVSDISSVSKTKGPGRKMNVPPPLPPKPRTKPKGKQNRNQGNIYEYDTEEYGSINTSEQVTNDDSTSAITQTTTQTQSTVRTMSEATSRTPSQSTVRTVSEASSRTPSQSTVRTMSEATSRTPSQSTMRTISESSSRTPSQSTFRSQSDTSASTVKQALTLPAQRVGNGDSSDSLSWQSSEDDYGDEEDTIISQSGSRTLPANSRQQTITELSKSITDELRFYKSMGDIHTASPEDIHRKVNQKLSLSEDPRQPTVFENRRQPTVFDHPRQQSVSDVAPNHRKRFESMADSDVSSQDLSAQNTSSGSIRSKKFVGHSIQYTVEGKQPFKLVGGNATGVFIHDIVKNSKAAKSGLGVGDQILELNGRKVKGMTREEVHNVLVSMKSEVHMVIKNNAEVYNQVLQKGGVGDNFFIRTTFSQSTSNNSELNFKKGDIFMVMDTLPGGSKNGMWHVSKMSTKPGPKPIGYIPNQIKADQISKSYKIAELRSIEIKNKGGSVRKSFKRAKSLDRGINKNDEDNFRETIKDVKGYECVIQKEADFKRPVILLGLFCDSVKDILLKDLPAVFAAPDGHVERDSTTGSDMAPINMFPIEEVIQKNRHCLLIISPLHIQYLKEQTNLDPIVIYLCPENKAIVKSLKARFAPGFDRKTGFMYDEALQFAKRHENLFNSVVYFTNNGDWLGNLRQTIVNLQAEPLWLSADPKSDSSSDDLADDASQTTMSSSGRGRQNIRASRTTDDLPNIPREISSVLNRHAGNSNSASMRSRSVGDALDSADDLMDTYMENDTDYYPKSPSMDNRSLPGASILKKTYQPKSESNLTAESSYSFSANSYNQPSSLSYQQLPSTPVQQQLYNSNPSLKPPQTGPNPNRQRLQKNHQPSARQKYLAHKRETPL